MRSHPFIRATPELTRAGTQKWRLRASKNHPPVSLLHVKPSFALIGEVVTEQSTFRRLLVGGQKVSVLGYVPAPLRMSTMSEPRANKHRGRQRRPRGGGGSSMGASVLMPLSFQ